MISGGLQDLLRIGSRIYSFGNDGGVRICSFWFYCLLGEGDNLVFLSWGGGDSSGVLVCFVIRIRIWSGAFVMWSFSLSWEGHSSGVLVVLSSGIRIWSGAFVIWSFSAFLSCLWTSGVLVCHGRGLDI